MSDTPQKDTITACIDGSNMGASIVDAAAWASTNLEAPLQLLHVIERDQLPEGDRSGSLGPDSASHLLDELTDLDEKRGKVAMALGKHMLKEAQALATKAGVTDISLHQRHGELLDALHDTEARTRLFVVGRLGTDHENHTQAMGAHLESLVRSLHTPILVSVGEFASPQSYMLAYDGSAGADSAIAAIANTAVLQSMQGHVVMVGNNKPANQSALNRAGDMLQEHGHSVQTHLLQGNIVEALLKFRESKNVGLTVMGAYGHSRVLEFFVGSNTSRMIRASEVPL
ncbi:MAG: universal stress protein, partial [Lysobacterales bacterium]